MPQWLTATRTLLDALVVEVEHIGSLDEVAPVFLEYSQTIPETAYSHRLIYHPNSYDAYGQTT